MMTEERTRFEVLLESIETKVKVIAEGHGALVERSDALAEGQRALVERSDALAEGQRTLVEPLDRMERRFESRFDVLESRFTRNRKLDQPSCEDRVRRVRERRLDGPKEVTRTSDCARRQLTRRSSRAW